MPPRRRSPHAPRALVLAALAAVAAASGAASAQSVTVTSEPAGARVEIDGVYAGTTPFVRDVAEGRRTVRVQRAGFAPWQREVDVAAGGSARVEARLERLVGTLQLDDLPLGAVVTVDGDPAEPRATVGAGIVTVAVRVAGRPVARQRVAVADGGITRVAYVPRRLDPTKVATALAAPGGVQIAERRPLVGIAVAAGVASGVGVALVANARMGGTTSDYDQAVRAYNEAQSEAEVDQALRQVDRATDRAEGLRSTRRIALGAAAAVYLAGAVDALLHHALRPALQSDGPRLPPISVHVRDTGVSLAVRF